MLLTLMPSVTYVHAYDTSDNVKMEHNVNDHYAKPENEREEINFNRDWKFYLGDVENGEQLAYDDNDWTDVALPHSFDLPYNMTSSFYVGYGWYRKTFNVAPDAIGKTMNLDFEGSFQETEVFINGEKVGTHVGGYTGFTFDISAYVHAGDNEVAVRVNNIWQPDVSPRAGDHQFTGGIYRDVTLTITDNVHVTWYGTYVTTPDLLNPSFDPSAENVLDHYTSDADIAENIKHKRSNVRVETEIANDSDEVQQVQVKQEVVNKDQIIVASFASDVETLQANEIRNIVTESEQIKDIELWDLDNPYVYNVYTTIYKNGEIVDVFTSPLGFRSAQYKNDAFYLNGEKILIDGANVHQDHGGWGNAVTNEGFYRDVQMIKDCGMNFIRGSHYPHDPAFAKACDEIGMLFWSEGVFWGMGGCAGQDAPATMSAGDWFKDAYPQNPDDEAAFEESCKQALTEMIRVNRNHPSIVNWSMGNEVFFTDAKTQSKAKALVNDLRNLAHSLDPSRKAGMGGVQREGYDKVEVSDIAGYNGDGGKFTNLTMPNVVAEYGSKAADRPGDFRPFYDQIQKPNDIFAYQLKENSAGLILWCGFHHGTIGGDGLAKMGMIDYYRLPLNTWYWYREQNLGIPREQSITGEAATIQMEASQTTLHNDGSDDAQVIVTMLDENGEWVNASPSVTLTVVDGPGVFPTGKSYTFVPNNTMRDGKAAIEFRSYYSGVTTIEAYTPGLPKTQIKLETVNVLPGEEGLEPDGFMVTEKQDKTDTIAEPAAYGKNNVALQRPAFPSSNLEDAGLASDQKLDTQWVAEKSGSGEYWMLDAEFEQYFYKAKLDFKGNVYPYRIEISNNKEDGPWTTVASYDSSTIQARPYEESLQGVKGRYVKVTFTDVPQDAYANLAEMAVYGNTASQTPAFGTQQVYLSDLTPEKITQGWVGMQPGIDVSIEGNPLRIGGVTYKKGLGLHADSEAIYTLNGQYSRFQAVIGMDDETQGRGEAIYRVFATIEGQEEQLIYEKAMTGGQSEEVDLSVNNVKTLRLVTDANGSNSSDHTNWAIPRLMGAVRDISKDRSDYAITYVGSQDTLTQGEDFIASVQLKNINNPSSTYSVALALYDENDKLIDIVLKDGYLVKGKSGTASLMMTIPENFTSGEARLHVFHTNTLKPYADTLHIASSTQTTKNAYAMRGIEISDEGWKRVDGEDELLLKEGDWALWDAGEASGAYKGSETFVEVDNWEGSSITYTFKGSQVRIGAKVDQSQVGAEVYIDGELVDTIHNTASDATNAYQLVWTSAVLPAKEHIIKLVPIGKFGLDYIETTGEQVKLDGEDARLNKIGNWNVWNAGADSGAYEGTETYVEKDNWEGSSIALTFTGTQVEIGAKFDQSQVGAKIYIDDVLVDTISTKTADAVNVYQKAWESELLEAKEHVLKIIPTGKFGLDYIAYTDYAGVGEPADKTLLIEAIDRALTKDENAYTPETWQVFDHALQSAIVTRDDEKATAAKINAALETLIKAEEQLKEKLPEANTQDLRAAMKQVLDLIEQDLADTYELEGIEALSNAFYSGYMLYSKDQIEQQRIDAATKAILSAMDALVAKEQDIAYCRKILMAAIDKAQTIKALGMLEHVNENVVNYFENALLKAVQVSLDDQADNATLLTAWKNLADAMHYLDFTADTTALLALIEEYEALDLTIYQDDENKVEFYAAMEHAKLICEDTSVLDVSIKKAFDRLVSAKSALVLVEGEIDLRTLTYMIQISDLAFEKRAYYDTAVNSWEEFERAYEQACTVRDQASSQDAVNIAAKALADAYENIRLIANEDTLKELQTYLASIDAIDLTAYRTESVMFFMNARAFLQEMVDNKTFTNAQFMQARSVMAEVMWRKQNDKVNVEAPNDADHVNQKNDLTKDTQTITKAPVKNNKTATGDTTQISWMLLGLCGAGGCLLFTKKSKKREK